MSKRILVVGLQLNDAGKTTLCKALIHGFKETGVALVPFKPHSGIGYWSQFDVFQRNRSPPRRTMVQQMDGHRLGTLRITMRPEKNRDLRQRKISPHLMTMLSGFHIDSP